MSATTAISLHHPASELALRLVAGTVVALFVTAGLFWLMQYLLEGSEQELNDTGPVTFVDFVRIDEPDEPKEKPLPPLIPPIKPPEAPPEYELDSTATGTPVRSVDMPLPTNPTNLPTTGLGGAFGEGDYLPIVKVTPIYPQRAISRGIEGYCVVQYTVTRNGTIANPFVVENQCSSSLFHRASIEAALKFKYKPRVVNGEAIEVSGVQNQFTYTLTD